MRRKNKNIYVGLTSTGLPPSLPLLVARGLYRWRWPLTPLYVAVGSVPCAWILAIVWATADTRWFMAVYAVAALCVVCWLVFGMRRLYDRIFTLLVALVMFAWTGTVALHPASGRLYGLWALGWPVLGLGWWCGSTFRNALTMDKMRRRWDSVAELAGIGGAILTKVRSTPVGQILTVKLPGNHTSDDISRKRIEAAYQLRPGSVTVVRDKANARRVDLHVVERDPWTSGRVIAHPAMATMAGSDRSENADQETTERIDADDIDNDDIDNEDGDRDQGEALSGREAA